MLKLQQQGQGQGEGKVSQDQLYTPGGVQIIQKKSQGAGGRQWASWVVAEQHNLARQAWCCDCSVNG
eukprot:11776200-Ditylum_brightwellii.AAC.1